jgi:hypothetical protein
MVTLQDDDFTASFRESIASWKGKSNDALE